MFFKRFIVTLFLSLGALILFITIIRLGKGKKGLLGFNDIITYAEQVDMSKPLTNFKDSTEHLTSSWNRFVISMTNIGLPNNSGGRGTSKDDNQIYQFFKGIGNFLGSIGNTVKDFFIAVISTLIYPIEILVDVLVLIVSTMKEFFDFINWCVTFEGYPPIDLTTI